MTYLAPYRSEFLAQLDRAEASLRADSSMKEDSTATGWSVITGPPGSGKTTLISALAEKGFKVARDIAREVLEQRTASGVSKHSLRGHSYSALQMDILDRMLRQAEACAVSERIYFDYGLPDNLAYLTLAGIKWSEKHIRAAYKYKYQRAFLLEPSENVDDLDWDPVRTEDFGKRQILFQLLEATYQRLETPITVVPRWAVSKRLDYVLRTP